LKIKPAAEARWDCVSFGEVMLRFDPGFGRVRNARSFTVWEGGGEYNVARAMRKCWGKRAAVVTALPKNDLGWLVEDFIMQGGVATDFIKWREDDGIGRTVRNGLNFTERGFGVRAAVGCSDRGHTAASQMKPGDVDWDKIFGRDGARWLHTGGIFAALSETTPLVAKEAMAAAKRHGTVVSYDLNYRASLWKSIGGKKRAQETNRELASYVDVMLGNEEDFTAALGFEVEGLDENLSALDPRNFERMIQTAVAAFPNFQAVATTLRNVRSASINDWAAVVYTGGRLYPSRAHDGLEIWDRVGGGDSFASGLVYGFLAGKDPQWAVDCGAAHGALAMTTPGDTTMASLAEVERVMKGGSARVQR